MIIKKVINEGYKLYYIFIVFCLSKLSIVISNLVVIFKKL